MAEIETAEIETLDARQLSAQDARAIAELLVKVWPKLEKPVEVRERQMRELGQGYSGPDIQAPRSFVIRENGIVIAHAAFVTRTILVGSQELTIAGLTRVCTDPSKRGMGLGEKIVRPVLDLVDQGVFDFSYFQTTPQVVPFYERLAAVLTTNRVVNSLAVDPRAYPFWDELQMRYPADRPWPEGVIDLRGPGF